MSTFSTSSRQKRLKTLSFLHFWLRNVLRATTACTFSTLFSTSEPPKVVRDPQFLTLLTSKCASRSTSQLPKVLREWCALYIVTSKCASRHNGVHFFRHLNFQKWSAPICISSRGKAVLKRMDPKSLRKQLLCLTPGLTLGGLKAYDYHRTPLVILKSRSMFGPPTIHLTNILSSYANIHAGPAPHGWNWSTPTSWNKKTMTSYQNLKVVNQDPGADPLHTCAHDPRPG